MFFARVLIRVLGLWSDSVLLSLLSGIGRILCSCSLLVLFVRVLCYVLFVLVPCPCSVLLSVLLLVFVISCPCSLVLILFVFFVFVCCSRSSSLVLALFFIHVMCYYSLVSVIVLVLW